MFPALDKTCERVKLLIVVGCSLVGRRVLQPRHFAQKPSCHNKIRGAPPYLAAAVSLLIPLSAFAFCKYFLLICVTSGAPRRSKTCTAHGSELK